MTERNQFTPSQLEWLAALESGEWKQAKGWLFDRGEGDICGHCCLGVRAEQLNLCEDKTGRFYRFGKERANAVAPQEVIDDLQLRGDCGEFLVPVDKFRSLAELNDDGDCSFAEIAAFIRANPWQVFRNFDRPEGA